MRRAFTRSEMLAVVAMLAIMAALAIPALAQVNAGAQRAECSRNVHTLGLGMQMLRMDHDYEWTREPPGETVTYPETIADIAALGYVGSLNCYVCPGQATPFTREPQLIEVPDALPPGNAPDVPLGTSFSQITDTCYFVDEGRIPKSPPAERVVLADGIEMLTHHGREPANHANVAGRAVGANALFADMGVAWLPVYRPDHEWVMDRHGANEPRGIGYAAGADNYPHVTGGTWRRSGFIQNVRLLQRDPEDDLPGGGTGLGEDDIDNSVAAFLLAYPDEFDAPRPLDVDDIYYEDCARGEYGAESANECEWGFVAKARGARFIDKEKDRDPLDCSLAGGSLRGWRGEDGIYKDYPQFSGSEGWGWPDELPDDAVWVHGQD